MDMKTASYYETFSCLARELHKIKITINNEYYSHMHNEDEELVLSLLLHYIEKADNLLNRVMEGS